MDLTLAQLVSSLIVIESLQLFIFWVYLRRYGVSLLQLGRLTKQLATGERPASFYVGGPTLVAQMAQNLEEVGTRLEDLQRRQQEEDFNLNVLLANMVEGVMVVDQRRIVRLVNDELLNLFALRTSPIDRTVLESLREARVEMIVRETLRKGEPQRQDVALESTSEVGQKHLEVSAVPIRTKAGEIGGAVLVFHDITRIKHLEVLRSEFVANVSHELRTPLAIFRGYLETLMEYPHLPPDESRRMLQAMQRHSERLNALVEDLLTLTRLETKPAQVEFSTVRLDALLRRIVQDWQQQMNSGHAEIQVNIPGELPAVELDPLRFEQVILNLLENAVAYSNPPRSIQLSAVLYGDLIEIRVDDNGIGIPLGDLPHIFERFYRVDKGRSRVSGGTGLGLSIVKHIMQIHRGTVHAESEMGKGTTVVLRMPLAQEELR